MTVPLTYIAPDVAVAGQLAPEHMREVAEAGFRSVVNNRPDFEGGAQQPRDSDIRASAERAGLEYEFLPVDSFNITATDVARFAELLEHLPRPLLVFCRSGARSTRLYRAATSIGGAAMRR